jgi:hypothetical protein
VGAVPGAGDTGEETAGDEGGRLADDGRGEAAAVGAERQPNSDLAPP